MKRSCPISTSPIIGSGASLGLCLAAFLFALPSSAQESKPTSFQLEHFEPLPAQSTNIANIASSEPVEPDRPTFGLTLHVVDDPLQLRTNGEVTTRVVDDQFKAELTAAYGFGGWADIGVAFPIVLFQSSEGLSDPDNFSSDGLAAGGADAEIDSFALGDLRLVPRARVVQPEWTGVGIGVAVMLPVYLPTGDTDSFNGEDGVRVEPRVAVDWTHEPTGLMVAANLGYQVRGETVALTYVSDDLLRFGIGALTPSFASLRGYGGLFGQFTLAEGRDPLDPATAAPNTEGQPMEAQVGVRYALMDTLSAQAGTGAGLTSGVGAPDFRLIAGVEYSPTIVFDADDDGVADEDDQCPDEVEDRDGFEDGDGCVDEDNDQDGLVDAKDTCPDDPEDLDGFNDGDGCPDVDNDEDLVADAEDRCPNIAGLQEFDGCPDADQDGVADDIEECPEWAEDVDGFEDDDGCPDWDNDGDGILDQRDQCPDEPEVVNLEDDTDGCPDEGESFVQVADGAILLFEPIRFYGRGRIRRKGRRVLDQVAALLKNHTSIIAIRIEVHSTQGRTPEQSKDISTAEAEAIHEYLVDAGVDPERLDVLGQGEEVPDAEKGNDRVELVIAERATIPPEIAAARAGEESLEPAEPDEAEEEDSEGFHFGTDEVE